MNRHIGSIIAAIAATLALTFFVSLRFQKQSDRIASLETSVMKIEKIFETQLESSIVRGQVPEFVLQSGFGVSEEALIQMALVSAVPCQHSSNGCAGLMETARKNYEESPYVSDTRSLTTIYRVVPASKKFNPDGTVLIHPRLVVYAFSSSHTSGIRVDENGNIWKYVGHLGPHWEFFGQDEDTAKGVREGALSAMRRNFPKV